jgi:peptidoglycan hydrolase-like protein with peptidoglycan-binding domain
MSERAIFPMTEMNITNGYHSKGLTGAHKIKIALDLVSSDGNFFAPFTGRIVKRQSPNTVGTVVLESKDKVLWADGTTEFMHVLCYHCNDISKLSEGQEIKQGVNYYRQGTQGGVPSHVHMEIGRGKYPGQEVSAGTADGKTVWKTKNEVEPFKALWISDKTPRIINDRGYAWKKIGTPIPDPTPVTKIYGPGYITNDPVIGSIAAFMRATFPSFTPAAALGNQYGPNIMGAIKEFQKRNGLVADGYCGPITQAKLREYGWKG